MLALLDWSQPFLLDTDASDTGICAVLSQVQDAKEHVIAYASRSLTKVTKAECNYCVTRRELLTVITYLQHFRPCFLGTFLPSWQIMVFLHNYIVWLLKNQLKALVGCRSCKSISLLLARVSHHPGKCCNNADAMCRIPCEQCGIVPAEEPETKFLGKLISVSLSASKRAAEKKL